MPGPTVRSGQVIDPILTNLARAYQPSGFIADAVAPRVPVEKEAGKYMVFAYDQQLRDDVDLMTADRSVTKEVELDFSTESYQVQEYRLKISISERERKNTDDIVGLERRKLQKLMNQWVIHRERRVQQLLTGVTTNATPSNNWNVDAATIQADVLAGQEASYDLTGVIPNTMIVPWKVANQVAMQQDIIEMLKYTVNGQQILREGTGILPEVLWGLRVVVAKPQYNAGAQGAAASILPIWGDEVKLLYVDPSPSLEAPSTAVTFMTQAPIVDRYTVDDPPNLEYIRVRAVWGETLVAPDTGYELRNLLS